MTEYDWFDTLPSVGQREFMALRHIVTKAIAFRDACAAEVASGWLTEVDERQAELFEALNDLRQQQEFPGGEL